MTRRLAQLAIGLWLFGISLAMVIRSGLGNAPWDVLHQGLANHLPITIGQAVIMMSLVVLAFLEIPLLPHSGTKWALAENQTGGVRTFSPRSRAASRWRSSKVTN